MSTILGRDTDLLPPARKHVVVIVDDEYRTLSAMARLLRNEPYEIRTTSKPSEALEWIARRDVSLVISDHLMPEMTGLDVAEAVKRLAPTTSVVILTAYADRIHSEPHWRDGVRELIEKPWDDRAFRRTILHLLRERELQDGRRVGSGESETGLCGKGRG
jgi:DNA-binding NtrC family response regulator